MHDPEPGLGRRVLARYSPAKVWLHWMTPFAVASAVVILMLLGLGQAVRPTLSAILPQALIAAFWGVVGYVGGRRYPSHGAAVWIENGILFWGLSPQSVEVSQILSVHASRAYKAAYMYLVIEFPGRSRLIYTPILEGSQHRLETHLWILSQEAGDLRVNADGVPLAPDVWTANSSSPAA
jgi:hypothetical protein